MSKLGFHIAGAQRTGLGDALRRCSAANHPVQIVKSVDDFSVLAEAKQIDPRTITIGRIRALDQRFDPNANPFDQAVSWYEAARPTWMQHRAYIDHWEVLNEISSHYGSQAAFFIELMHIIEPDGFSLCLFNFSTGNPPLPADDNGDAFRSIAAACGYGKSRGAILGLHEYGNGGRMYDADGAPLEGVRRYRVLAEYLRSVNSLIPFAITETAPDPFTYFGDDIAFVAELGKYDLDLMEDDYVLGNTIFTLGGGAWQEANYEAALPLLADWIIAHPSPIPIPPPAPCRGIPRVNYARTYNAIPNDDPNLTPEQNEARAVSIFLEGWRRSRETAGGSYDDAGIGDLDNRTANLYGLPIAVQPTFNAWYAEHYPGVHVVHRPIPGTIVLPPPEPEPQPIWNGALGVGTARSGDFTAQEIDALRRARLTAFKFKTDESRDKSAIVQQLGISAGNIIQRLFWQTGRALPSPHDFVADMRTPMGEQWQNGVRKFEVLNEPNIEYVGMGARNFAAWLRIVYDLILPAWPGVQLISPGMSPHLENDASNTDLWMHELDAIGVLRDSAFVGVHSYAPVAELLADPKQGFFFTRYENLLKPNQKMALTEWSINQDLQTDEQKAHGYLAALLKLPPYIALVYIFALSSDDPLYDQRRETWVRNRGTLIMPIVDIIGGR